MKALVTGVSGTVGTALARHLRSAGDEVVAWDRSKARVDRYQEMEDLVRSVNPDVLFHLAIASVPTGMAQESWLVNYEWASELAWVTRVLGVSFVFTSSAMVFSDRAKGPFTVDREADAETGYGYEKRMAEQRVFSQNPCARVVRLGWQIGEAPGSNNMIDYFDRSIREHGVVRASRRWFPATSFLADTALALRRVATEPPGLYQIDSNRRWSFYEIASALSRHHGGRWQVEACDDFVYDQRLVDERLLVPRLEERLKELLQPCG